MAGLQEAIERENVRAPERGPHDGNGRAAIIGLVGWDREQRGDPAEQEEAVGALGGWRLRLRLRLRPGVGTSGRHAVIRDTGGHEATFDGGRAGGRCAAAECSPHAVRIQPPEPLR